MARDKLEKLFLQEKPGRIVLALRSARKPIYVARLAKETDSTYAHTFRLISKLKELGLVISKEEGRIKLVKLTVMGEALADQLSDLLYTLELVEISAAIDNLYDREVKGRLRGDINKEAVLSRLEQQTKRLERLASEKQETIMQLAKKELKRVEDISREIKGLIVG